VRLIRKDQELTVTTSAPPGSPDLETFVPAAEDKTPGADGAAGELTGRRKPER
jgi:hypothetical protein